VIAKDLDPVSARSRVLSREEHSIATCSLSADRGGALRPAGHSGQVSPIESSMSFTAAIVSSGDTSKGEFCSATQRARSRACGPARPASNHAPHIPELHRLPVLPRSRILAASGSRPQMTSRKMTVFGDTGFLAGVSTYWTAVSRSGLRHGGAQVFRHRLSGLERTFDMSFFMMAN
jgi:hypothetical protein